jgi:phage portal protein BeeE
MKPVDGGDTPYLQQQNYSLSALNKRDALEDPFKSQPQINDEQRMMEMSMAFRKELSDDGSNR